MKISSTTSRCVDLFLDRRRKQIVYVCFFLLFLAKMMSESAKSFFDILNEDYPESVYAEGEKLPLDVGRSLLTREEIEGECVHYCLRFLADRYHK